MVWIIVAVALVLLVLGVWWAFNRIVRDNNLVFEAWSGIDVQLKRRHNLIPNLVESVKGYARHEKAALEEVTKLRGADLDTAEVKTRQAGENALPDGLKRLFALAEAYPDLKASQSFLDLQENLSEIEDQIQMARRYYNGAVRNYNIRIQSFPTNLVAKSTGYKRADFFEIETATERQVPDVEL